MRSRTLSMCIHTLLLWWCTTPLPMRRTIHPLLALYMYPLLLTLHPLPLTLITLHPPPLTLITLRIHPPRALRPPHRHRMVGPLHNTSATNNRLLRKRTNPLPLRRSMALRPVALRRVAHRGTLRRGARPLAARPVALRWAAHRGTLRRGARPLVARPVALRWVAHREALRRVARPLVARPVAPLGVARASWVGYGVSFRGYGVPPHASRAKAGGLA